MGEGMNTVNFVPAATIIDSGADFIEVQLPAGETRFSGSWLTLIFSYKNLSQINWFYMMAYKSVFVCCTRSLNTLLKSKKFLALIKAVIADERCCSSYLPYGSAQYHCQNKKMSFQKASSPYFELNLIEKH